ncbi:hypothetical protein ACFV3E_42770 [Streptomyces sp. NPDC059718]
MGVTPLPPVAYDATSPQQPSGAGDLPDVPERAGFGMAHALVLIFFIVTAAVLAELGMRVEDVLFLLGGAGGIGAVVLLLVITSGRTTGRLGRALDALDAYRRSGR